MDSIKELNKNDTKMIRGLSVIAMLILHLFDRNHDGLFTPLLFFQGTAISFFFAQLCDFCVFGFAFLSGYGHMAQFQKGDTQFYRKRLKGLLSVFTDFWVILIVFSIVSILVGNGENMPESIGRFFLAAFAMDNSFNGAWWYLYAYAIIVLISPWLLKRIKNDSPIFVVLVCALIYCVSYYIRFKVLLVGLLLPKIGPIGMTLAEYMIGAMCFKYKIFSYVYSYWKRLVFPVRFFLSMFILLIMLYGHTKIVASLFIAPVTGSVIISLFHFWEKPVWIQKTFLFLGNHSTNIWLTHMFFFSVLFKDFVYLAKYPICILGLLMAIVIGLSMILQLIQNPIKKKIAAL